MISQLPELTIEREGVSLHTRSVGQGSPLLLLHGHPQSMVMWHKVVEPLSASHTLVLMDLRGYGDSARPPADPLHHNHSKRQMALDAIAVMQAYGFNHFDVLAHDRGARVAHRLAIDHPSAVRRLMLLDIAPTLAMYENTNDAFARAYWHWFALIQPAPIPEVLIDSHPAQYVRGVMGGRYAGLAPFTPQALAEYERCVSIPGTGTSICEDYRASANIDLEHDRMDIQAARKMTQPVKVLWGEHGAVGKCFDVMSLWQERALRLSGEALPCGHYIAEELPQQLSDQALEFFKD